MSKFYKELRLNRPVCVELLCKECGNKFSTELDVQFKSGENHFQSSDNLYCSYCEEPYEYMLKYDNSNLSIEFKTNELFGGLKYSNSISFEEYRTATPQQSKKYFFLELERLQKILRLNSIEPDVELAKRRLVFSGIITCLETYLGEIFNQIVFHSSYTLEVFVANYEPYKKEKITVHEIFTKHNSLKLKVKDDLDNFIFHNVSKLINIFNIYEFELHNFEKIERIAIHIQKRHNFVHRSGIDKEDNLQDVLKTEIDEVIKDVSLFVEYIDNKIISKFLLQYDDDELPF
ncbi:hypothetical protein [Salinimicrobium terrae]|uniref:hypothetical protein n=1 Tax=Salinimicrobium terrae TaxID=470866 RepID=UPI000423AAF3|nr:hypothetical protein [Salinimicrobium terrae]